MKVAVIPADTGACGYYRLIWPAEAVKMHRPDWQVDVYNPADVKLGRGTNGLLVRGIDLEGVDLVVMQRVGMRQQVEMIRHLQNNGIAVVLDADDAMWAIDRDNSSWKAWNVDKRQHWRNLDDAMRLADLATVTTDALASRYGAHGRVETIPNYLPERAFGSPYFSDGDQVVLGWSGFIASHPHDLDVVGDAVSRVLDEDDDVYLKIVGDRERAASRLSAPLNRALPQPTVNLRDYHKALHGTDVGLVPLEDTPFNRAKSWLKGIEYLAAGALVVASPTSPYRALAQSVDAPTAVVHASDADEWYRVIKNRIETVRHNREAMSEMAVRSARRLVITGKAHLWANAWQRAVDRRQALSR